MLHYNIEKDGGVSIVISAVVHQMRDGVGFAQHRSRTTKGRLASG